MNVTEGFESFRGGDQGWEGGGWDKRFQTSVYDTFQAKQDKAQTRHILEVVRRKVNVIIPQ